MSTYKIDYTSTFEEGGCCQFYPILHKKNIGFKEFRNKKDAVKAFYTQKKLSKFDLAPKIYGSVCKLKIAHNDNNTDSTTNWGYVTEVAIVDESERVALKKIQQLVDDIYAKTKLKFWDCHYYNMGLISRKGKKKLVCIDTGSESFDGYSNAWGYADPGPKCSYCKRFKCVCREE